MTDHEKGLMTDHEENAEIGCLIKEERAFQQKAVCLERKLDRVAENLLSAERLIHYARLTVKIDWDEKLLKPPPNPGPGFLANATEATVPSFQEVAELLAEFQKVNSCLGKIDDQLKRMKIR